MTSHKKTKLKESWKEHPFLTRKGINLIKSYNAPRTDLSMGRYASYRDYGEDIWRIGYGSKKLGKSYLGPNDIATEEEVNNIEDNNEIDTNLQEDEETKNEN